MSVISNAAHNVIAYESGKTKALAGQRLAVFTYKTSQDKESLWYGIKRPSKAVSLPAVHPEEVTRALPLLMPHIIAMCHGVQDKIMREKLDASSDLLHIAGVDINMDSILAYLDDSNESGRLTKETVATWFDGAIADNLMLALAERMGVSDTPTDAQSAQIERLVGEFKNKVAGLAGGKTSYEPKLCESIKKVVALAPAGDPLATRFTARLDKMIADSANSVSLLDAL